MLGRRESGEAMAGLPGDQREQGRKQQAWTALRPIVDLLRREGYYAYLTLGSDNEWLVACDTDLGRVDIRIGSDGLLVEVWDTSPGLFWDDEDERRRAARERLARITLPAVARGLLDPDEEAWWDETDHGVGLRLRLQVPFGAQHLLAQVIEEMLARLNDDIGRLEKRLVE
jgi:hypothetical protein